MWSQTNEYEVLPPEVEKKPGRKQKAKRREPEVPTPIVTSLSRKGRKMACSCCGEVGHNKRTCKTNKAVPCGQGEVANPTPTPAQANNAAQCGQGAASNPTFILVIIVY